MYLNLIEELNVPSWKIKSQHMPFLLMYQVEGRVVTGSPWPEFLFFFYFFKSYIIYLKYYDLYTLKKKSDHPERKKKKIDHPEIKSFRRNLVSFFVKSFIVVFLLCCCCCFFCWKGCVVVVVVPHINEVIRVWNFNRW